MLDEVGMIVGQPAAPPPLPFSLVVMGTLKAPVGACAFFWPPKLAASDFFHLRHSVRVCVCTYRFLLYISTSLNQSH